MTSDPAVAFTLRRVHTQFDTALVNVNRAEMRPMPSVPLKRSQTIESLNSVDSVSVTSSDRPHVLNMVPKVDVEIKFNGENVSNGRPVSELW